jgi:hypothetical protein
MRYRSVPDSPDGAAAVRPHHHEVHVLLLCSIDQMVRGSPETHDDPKPRVGLAQLGESRLQIAKQDLLDDSLPADQLDGVSDAQACPFLGRPVDMNDEGITRAGFLERHHPFRGGLRRAAEVAQS